MSYEPSRSDVIADPYPTYRVLRETDPLHWSPAVRAWVVTRYDDVQQLLHDPRLSADRISPFIRRLPAEVARSVEDLGRVLGSFMNFADPPKHTRLRALVSKAFAPRTIAALESRIRALVDQLVPRDGGELDAIADFATPFPLLAIGELLGIDTSEQLRLKRWSDDLAALIGGALKTDNKLGRAVVSLREMIDWFTPVIERRRREPARDDLLGQLIAAEDAGQILDTDELLATIVLLIGAGHETTTNLIGNGLSLLAQHPEAFQLLRSRPELAGSAVEEVLRYESPNQNQGRIALEAIQLHGKTIAAGDVVSCMISAANRDPRAFADADRFDIARDPNRHLTFGHGRHHCVGAPLARLEGRIAFATIAARYRELGRVDADARWSDSLTFRGLTALPMRFVA